MMTAYNEICCRVGASGYTLPYRADNNWLTARHDRKVPMRFREYRVPCVNLWTCIIRNLPASQLTSLQTFVGTSIYTPRSPILCLCVRTHSVYQTTLHVRVCGLEEACDSHLSLAGTCKDFPRDICSSKNKQTDDRLERVHRRENISRAHSARWRRSSLAATVLDVNIHDLPTTVQTPVCSAG